MTTIDATLRRSRAARDLAHLLGATTDQSAVPIFSAELVQDLPEPARRWLCHAITPGARLAPRTELRMHGEIKLGRHWHHFTADQTLVPDRGFVWAARTRVAGLPVAGFDSYVDGVGTMRWRMLGIPIVHQAGSAVTRSAFGRLAAESVLLPTSLVAAPWRHRVGPDAAVYTHAVRGRDGHAHVTIKVGPDGRLVSVRMHRWGNPRGQGFQLQPFEVTFAGEYDAGSLRIPDQIVASWPYAGGDFFRASLDAVTVA